MFNFFFPTGRRLFFFQRSAWLLLPAILTACRSAPPLPKANLSEPGWSVRQGQAAWRQTAAAPEIAGEILLATNANHRAFVQFTKTPFALAIAQTTASSWQIESPAENRRHSARGAPPNSILWFEFIRAIDGDKLPANWSWKKSGNNWRLENRSTGESLEGYLTE